MKDIFIMFRNMLNSLFNLLNQIVFYDSETGVVISYGWLIVGFIFLGMVITIFWRGAKQ